MISRQRSFISPEYSNKDSSLSKFLIFKNMSDEKKYEHFVESVAKDCHYDYAEIVEKLKVAHNKLGMNMRLLIQSIIDKHNYEKT